MTTVADVAAYILEKRGPLTAMKLQKLAYYSQAWSLVWDEKPLFQERIEAWVHGPVCVELYKLHQGQFQISTIPGGDGSRLSEEDRQTVDAVLKFYGEMTAQQLSDLTHREDPWKKARAGLPPGLRGDKEISLDAMNEYYSQLS